MLPTDVAIGRTADVNEKAGVSLSVSETDSLLTAVSVLLLLLLGLHYSKKSREAAIVRQVGSAASRSSLLLVHLVSIRI